MGDGRDSLRVVFKNMLQGGGERAGWHHKCQLIIAVYRKPAEAIFSVLDSGETIACQAQMLLYERTSYSCLLLLKV